MPRRCLVKRDTWRRRTCELERRWPLTPMRGNLEFNLGRRAFVHLCLEDVSFIFPFYFSLHCLLLTAKTFGLKFFIYLGYNITYCLKYENFTEVMRDCMDNRIICSKEEERDENESAKAKECS